MTQYSHILDIFTHSTLKIINMDKLKQYINYCIDNNTITRIKGQTSLHHILPKSSSCFPQYKLLSSHDWNGVHLTFADHYYAHWLFTEAIDDYSQLFAFCSMHNKDIKLGRISEQDLISEESFQTKMEMRSIKQSVMYECRKEEINEKISKAKKGKPSNKRKEIRIFNIVTNEELYFDHYQSFKSYCKSNQMSNANLYTNPNRICGWTRAGFENTINWVYVTDIKAIYYGPTEKAKTLGSTGMKFN